MSKQAFIPKEMMVELNEVSTVEEFSAELKRLEDFGDELYKINGSPEKNGKPFADFEIENLINIFNKIVRSKNCE